MNYAVQVEVLHDLLENPQLSLPDSEILAVIRSVDPRAAMRLDRLRDYVATLFESRGQKRCELQGDANSPVFQADKDAEYDVVVLKGTRKGVKVQISAGQKVVREFETNVESPYVPPVPFKAGSSGKYSIRVTRLSDGGPVLSRVLVFRKK